MQAIQINGAFLIDRSPSDESDPNEVEIQVKILGVDVEPQKILALFDPIYSVSEALEDLAEMLRKPETNL